MSSDQICLASSEHLNLDNANGSSEHFLNLPRAWFSILLKEKRVLHKLIWLTPPKQDNRCKVRQHLITDQPIQAAYSHLCLGLIAKKAKSYHNSSIKAVAKSLWAQASDQFVQRPNFASNFKVNGTIFHYPPQECDNITTPYHPRGRLRKVKNNSHHPYSSLLIIIITFPGRFSMMPFVTIKVSIVY